MKILVLTGSPHKAGTSALLADEFIAGAKEAGHEVVRFDSAFKNISGCMACDYCKSHDFSCVQKDDMEEFYPHFLSSDMIAFVTPVYYFDMTSQIKAVIDRFYAYSGCNDVAISKAALLATLEDDARTATDGLATTYEAICNYCGWEDMGRVLAYEAAVREDIEKSEYPAQARAFGKSLK